jgi:hypothetical protein
MKFKVLLVTLIVAIAVAAPVFAVDDTLIVMTNRPTVGGNDSLFIVEVWLFNDEATNGVQCGFHWVNSNLVADSAKPSAGCLAVWNSFIYWEGNNRTTTNTNKRFQFTGFGLFGGDLPAVTQRQLLATYYFTLSSWSVDDEIIVDTASWDDGTELQVLENSVATPTVYFRNQPIIVRDPSDAGESNNDQLPKTYSLQQNYPNPFNPSTTIEFTMPVAGDYELTVYNVIGQVVKAFKDHATAGTQHVVWEASSNASGVYFYKLSTGNFTETKKMMLVK